MGRVTGKRCGCVENLNVAQMWREDENGDGLHRERRSENQGQIHFVEEFLSNVFD